MGSSNKRSANLLKNVQNGQNEKIVFAICEMQGWRQRMEDASICSLNYDQDTSLFAVLDGHGGNEISTFVATNFLNVFTSLELYKNKEYEQALIKTFLILDELLKLKEVNEMLKSTLNSESANIEEISYNYYLEWNSPGTPSPKRMSPMKTPSTSSLLKRQESKFLEIEETSSLVFPESFFINGKSILFNPLKARIRSDSVAMNIGTTANIAFIRKNVLYLANAGDCLAVLYKNGKAQQLNREHKTYLPSEFARISKTDMKVVNNRIDGRINLTRAIGDLSFKNDEKLNYYQQAVIAYPEVQKIKLNKECEFLIICCDGVWDCVNIQQFCDYISNRLKQSNFVQLSNILSDVFDQTISKTNSSPVGTDNMTACLIVFKDNLVS